MDNLVNFTREDTGTATLARAVPKVDTNTADTHQWDVDLVAEVNEQGAAHVAPALPGVGDHLARARDGQGSATITIRPTQRDLRLTLWATDQTVIVEDCPAEVRQLRMHLTEKAQTYVARLRLYGLPPAVGAALVGCLGKPLQVHAVPLQQAFAFEGAPLGSIVAANGGTVFGVLKRRTDAGMVIDNFGLVHTVDKVEAAIQLADGWRPQVERYAAAVQAAGGSPTWRDLVAALAAVGDGTTVDDAVVAAAVAEHLPPEAGAAIG